MPPALFPAAHSSMLSRSWASRILCYTDKTIFEISQACQVRVASSISSDLTWPKRELYYLPKMGETGTCGQIVQCLPDCWQLELAAGLTVPLQWIWGKWTKKLQEWSKNMEQLPHNKLLQRLQLLRLENMQMTQVHEILNGLETRQTAENCTSKQREKGVQRKRKEELWNIPPPSPNTWTFYKLLLLLQLWLMWKEVQES